MAELKTRATNASVSDFINALDEQRRKDCQEIAAMMESATKARPVMWGSSIVGFGDFEYMGSTGKSTRWFLAGFSPRKQALTLYLMGGKDKELLAKLGKATMGGSCLYIKKLDDVHRPTLRKLIATSLKQLKAQARKKKS